MRIGILTFHHSVNCGAALQAWALQKYLRSICCDAFIVNYGKIGWSSRYYVKLDTLRHVGGTIWNLIRTFCLTFVIESYRLHLYRRFMKNVMGLGQDISKEQIERLEVTHLITGSDQVWNPLLNEGDETYFLANVASGVKRVAYAPSFGSDSFSPELELKMSQWLSRFDALSVREPQGAEIVRRLSGRDACVVCDPTLLLTQEDYKRIERRPRFGLPNKYIAVYTICGHAWAESQARMLGAVMKLPVVHLQGGQPARWHWHGKVRRIAALGPSEWLWYMRRAEFVVTNSFHGTVFSVLFHRPFWVAFNGKASDARMKSLLAEIGLSSRGSVNPIEVDALEDISIDWANADLQIARMTKFGQDYLKGVLKRAE